jgi:hypothetical protein
MAAQSKEVLKTPVEVVAQVARIVTKVTDRITGDRADSPLLVAAAVVEGLKGFGIQSQIMYGEIAWIEVLEDNSAVWAGCWGDHYGFWVSTESGELIDLNMSVNFRKQAHQVPHKRPILSPPMLWTDEVPAFCKFKPIGVAQVDPTEEREAHQYELVLSEVREKCTTAALVGGEGGVEFPNEAIICTGRRILDDSNDSFKLFDRVLSVRGVPKAPF